MSVELLTEHHLELLSLNGGCTGSSQSTLVKMPHCWKLHVTAQIVTIVAYPDPVLYTGQRSSRVTVLKVLVCLTNCPNRGRFKFCSLKSWTYAQLNCMPFMKHMPFA